MKTETIECIATLSGLVVLTITNIIVWKLAKKNNKLKNKPQ